MTEGFSFGRAAFPGKPCFSSGLLMDCLWVSFSLQAPSDLPQVTLDALASIQGALRVHPRSKEVNSNP